MLFPSEAIETARQKLAEHLESGQTPPESAFAQLLEVDPTNRTALFELARLRQEAGDLAQAETYAQRGLEAHTCDYRFYVLYAGIAAPRDAPLSAGFMELGVLKLLGDPDSIEDASRLRALGRFGDTPTERAALDQFAEELALQREHEQPAVTEGLRPYRHLHELQEALGNELDRGLVDAILQDGPRCLPLLTAVLRGLAEDYLPEGGDLMAEAALALIGEIGDPASVHNLVNFAVVEDKALSDISTWALLRIATRKPEETAAALADFDRAIGGTERACIAETLATMPPAQGKAAALLSLLDGFAVVEPNERTDTFVVIAAGLLAVDGQPAVATIRKALDGAGAMLPKETGPAVEDMLKAYASDPTLFAIADEEKVPTVYDICCADRIAAYEDEEEEEEEHVHGPGCNHGHAHGHTHVAPNLPGRNDPCWCGSGRKYKKCHLAQDEAARLGNDTE